MTLPAIKRSTANRLAKYLRNEMEDHLFDKTEVVKLLAKFFKSEDHFFRDDIFYNVATGKLTSDPAIKNPKGFNQHGKSKDEI